MYAVHNNILLQRNLFSDGRFTQQGFNRVSTHMASSAIRFLHFEFHNFRRQGVYTTRN